MPTSVDEFKQAFASKVADVDLKDNDKRFANALKRLDQSIEALGGDAAAGVLPVTRKDLVKEYQNARGQSGQSAIKIAALLDPIIARTEAAIPNVNAAPTDAGWSISPDGVQAQFSPYGAKPIVGIPKLDQKYLDDFAENDRKQREQKLKDAQDALEEARKWLVGQSQDALRKLTYPEIMVAVKEKFPGVNDLPKPKMLMDMVDKALRDNYYLLNKELSSDAPKLAMQKIIAAYIAALPKNIKPIISDGGITLVMIGAGSAGGGAEAKPGDQQPDKFEFKNKYYNIQITNEVWKALDPSMRAKWKSLQEEATALEKLMAAITSLKKEWKTSSSKAELDVRIKKLEAEFKGRWDTFEKSINATAKLTTDGFKATLTEARKKSKDTKVEAELELKVADMSAGLKAFATTRDLKTAFTVIGSAEKFITKVETEVLRTGTVVTLTYETALREVKEQLELQVKQGNTTVTATLKKEVVKLEDKLKELKDGKAKEPKDIKSLEEGLEKLQAEVKAEFKAGNFKVVGGGKVSSDGEAGGTVKVELMLKEGIRFLGEGQKVSFSADVSNKGYKFALMFSVGEMPDIDDVHKANKEADEKIRKLYDKVKDAQIRNMDDASKIKDALAEVIKPLKKSVDSMKKANKKKYAVELGLTFSGEFPTNGRMPPPMAGFGLKVTF